MPKTLLAVPVFNEEHTLPQLLQKLKPFAGMVLLVDDGSTDNSYALIKESGFKVIRLQFNVGLSHVFRLIIAYAYEHGANKLLLMDADGQHETEDIEKFIKMLDKHPFVSGKRFDKLQEIPNMKVASNLFACLLVKRIMGIDLPDVACGFRGFNLDLLPFKLRIPQTEQRFEGFYSLLLSLIDKKVLPAYIPIRAIYAPEFIRGTHIYELRGLINALMQFDHNRELAQLGIASFIDNPQSIKLSLNGFLFGINVIDDQTIKFGLLNGDPANYFNKNL